MGKIEEGYGSGLVTGQNGEPTTSDSSSRSFCGRCATGISKIAPCLNFKCLLVFLLSLSVFISALFLLIPHASPDSGYDASQMVKLGASVQTYFRLQRPVSQLVPRIRQLEDEINEEIGVPYAKVVVMSMHKSHVPNSTCVIIGFLPDPETMPMNPVSLSVLKSSLIELFLQESNLTLTSSTFGSPTSFEIIKFTGGITVIPHQPAPVSQIVQTLFNFTVNNSIYDVKENLDLLKMQLKTGLRLRYDENVYVQVTNKAGSTSDPPVIVQASVLSDMGSLQPQRLKQLAQTIQYSSFLRNLGLNNSMFGRVKSVSLSSYLSHTLVSDPPSPSPSPEPALPPCSVSPDYISSPPSTNQLSPCPTFGAHSPSPVGNSPQSSKAPILSPQAHRVFRGASPPSPSPSFHHFPFRHHIFMQGLEKSSSGSLVPRAFLSSGPCLGIHIMIWVAAVLHLPRRLF